MGSLKNHGWVNTEFLSDAVKILAFCLEPEDMAFKLMPSPKISYPCQCFSTASVESMIVPSISKSKPAKVASSAGAV